MARALLITTLICAIVAGVWYYHSNSFACGRFDSQSSCLSSIQLDTDALAIKNPRVSIHAVDLSPTANQVVVALHGQYDDSNELDRTVNDDYAALILFDTDSGQPASVLRELWGNGASIESVAFSSDGSLVASYGVGLTKDSEIENSLIVQDTTGKMVYVVRNSDDTRVYDCTRRLDFSSDNESLQCGTVLYNLKEGISESFDKEDRVLRFPQVADLSIAKLAESTEGVRTKYGDTNTKQTVLTFPDGSERIYPITDELNANNIYKTVMFSPDGQSFLDVQTVENEDGFQGLLQNVLKLIQPMTKAVVWDLEGDVKQSIVSSSNIYEMAWSRDGESFAFLGEDLKLSIFDAN